MVARFSILLCAFWLAACDGPGTVHIARFPSGKVKEMWRENGPPGQPTARHGLYQSYYADGARESEIEYVKGRKNGQARGWTQRGKLIFAGDYADDFLIREQRYDTAGNLTSDREYSVGEAKVMSLGPSGDSLEVLEACAYLEASGSRSRHGLCRMAYPEGGILSTRYYHFGRLHGPVQAWYPDGALWMEGSYERGVPTGAWKTLARDGKPLWSADFAKGERHGIWQEWFPDGKPKARAAYRGGKPDGPYQEWYRNGKPRLSGERRQGRREGLETAWYPDGGRLYEARYAEGRLEGEFKQWYPDGKPRLQCRFLAGRKHGPSRLWHRQGGLMELALYRDGKLNGPYKSFSADGKLMVTKEFHGGELAFDSKAKELLDLLGAEKVQVPVGIFGLYWGMTKAESRGALSVLQASGLRQAGETMSAQAALFADQGPKAARLRLRFNSQGELWQIGAEITQHGEADAYSLFGKIEKEIDSELGQPVMRKVEGSRGYRITRKRDWGVFSVTSGAEVPIRQHLPVVTAEGVSPGTGAAFRFTLSNHLFREYVNPANASVTPPEWPEATFLAGR